MALFCRASRGDRFKRLMLDIYNIKFDIFNKKFVLFNKERGFFMSGKFRAAVMVFLLVCVVVSIGAFAISSYPIEPSELVIFPIAGVLVLGAFFIIQKKVRAVSRGLPVKDEMERRVSHKSGYYAFIASVWFSLAVMFYAGVGVEEFNLPALLPRHYPAVILAFTCFVFVVSYLVLERKGSVE